ncbi:MAG: 30S ribosomal protein S15 [Candidatus Aenigmarchaeota archaeon]|nr:30S ribosomal protein S15 [Candidatus Aenigmarchaeota archaeon]
MARMYSRRKGKSGSKKPVQKIAGWVKYTESEIEDIAVKLAKKGMQSAQIGLVLRDQYGLPTAKLRGLKVSVILKKKGLAPEYPDDLMNLLRRAVYLYAHLGHNKNDFIAKRGLELTESRIRRMAKYYRASKVLPADWKYDIERAKLLVK